MGISVADEVSQIRTRKGLTQKELAEAAGVSLSTVRRLERDSAASFHTKTERALERVLGLVEGGLQAIRDGRSSGEMLQNRWTMHLDFSGYRYERAPLKDVIASDSYTARVIARELQDLVSRREQELSLLGQGRLWAGSGDHPGQWLFEWLPWVARLKLSTMWLDRMFDSCEQVSGALFDGDVVKPLRMAEAVAIMIGFDRAWAVSTNSFFIEGDEIEDGSWAPDDVFSEVDPRPLLERGRTWGFVPTDSRFHPHRWWEGEDEFVPAALQHRYSL